MSKKVHFIAIGGSVMHNLAIALHNIGYQVSGSDDKLFEPSKSRLAKLGLLPQSEGWNPDLITEDIDEVILGMHAREDNPELLKAQELGLPIYSFPDYIYKKSKSKQRIVIAGSHGKTTTTAMVLHVLKTVNKPFDYLVGAQLDGFETMVQISDAPIIILEGDEYLTSPLDLTPKFLKYHHHIVSISGIAWDHINVFPTFEEYKKQFELLIDNTPKAGAIIYNEEDVLVKELCDKDHGEDIATLPFSAHKHSIKNGETILETKEGNYKVQIFGAHNLSNLSAAKEICNRLRISDKEFYEAISSFSGAQRRLQLLANNEKTSVFNDFAHSPSKVKASSKALHNQFKERELVTCLELHTFSSLTKEFLKEYKNTLSGDKKIVFFNPESFEHRKLENFDTSDVLTAFDDESIEVYTDSNQLLSDLKAINWTDKNLLLMSSGDFAGINIAELALDLTN